MKVKSSDSGTSKARGRVNRFTEKPNIDLPLGQTLSEKKVMDRRRVLVRRSADGEDIHQRVTGAGDGKDHISIRDQWKASIAQVARSV